MAGGRRVLRHLALLHSSIQDTGQQTPDVPHRHFGQAGDWISAAPTEREGVGVMTVREWAEHWQEKYDQYLPMQVIEPMRRVWQSGLGIQEGFVTVRVPGVFLHHQPADLG